MNRLSFSQFLALSQSRQQKISRPQPRPHQIPIIKKDPPKQEIKEEIINKETENADEIRRIQHETITKLKLLRTHSAILNYLKNLPVIRKFNNVHTSSVDVCLLEGYIVRKICIRDSLGSFMFRNEVKALKKLSCFPHFPFLIASDQNSLTIYMTYCGPQLSSDNLPNNWKTQFQEISDIMNTTNVNSNDILLRNVCCLGDEIKIIDFGLHTIFGRTVKEVVNDLYIILTNLDKNNSHSHSHTSEQDIEFLYNRHYPNWRKKLEYYDLFNKKYQEAINNMKNKKNNIYKKK
jgi:tRNA A-37 threonylcarbamoyl transferase component Bud32